MLLHISRLKAVDLARATGLSEAAISDYLKGKKEARGRQSITIAKALNVSLDTLWETGYNGTGSGDITNNLNIDDDIKQLAKQYRLLSDTDRKLIKNLINSLAEKIEKT